MMVRREMHQSHYLAVSGANAMAAQSMLRDRSMLAASQQSAYRAAGTLMSPMQSYAMASMAAENRDVDPLAEARRELEAYLGPLPD